MFQHGIRDTNSPISTANFYRCIKRFFNYLVEQGKIKTNPLGKLKAPRVEKKLIRPLSDGDMNILLTLCDPNTYTGVRNYAILMMFLDTGLRLSEMSRIKLEDISRDMKSIRVMGKGAKERVVAFGNRTRRALVSYIIVRKSRVKEDSGEWLWINEEGHHLKYWGIEAIFRSLKELSGIKDVRVSPHTLRHTFGTDALKHGATLFEVQSLLGHSSLEMVRRYSASLNSQYAAEKHKHFSPVDKLKP